MPNYRRAWAPGGTWFFTVNLMQRHGNDLLVRHIDVLRAAVAETQRLNPFTIHGFVILPDHLHAVLELPQGESDFALRWRRIKALFSKSLPNTEIRSESRLRRGERGIWQRRYWEHLIRDAADYRAHMDYVHVNPLKHGLVTRVQDWPYSTFHKYVETGVYPLSWCGEAGVGSLDYPD